MDPLTWKNKDKQKTFSIPEIFRSRKSEDANRSTFVKYWVFCNTVHGYGLNLRPGIFFEAISTSGLLDKPVFFNKNQEQKNIYPPVIKQF